MTIVKCFIYIVKYIHAVYNNFSGYSLYRFNRTQCSHLQGKDTLAFAPFGHGRCKCPAYLFMYIEVSIFLTILLQQFTLKPVEKLKDVEEVYGLVTAPRSPLKYYIHPIENCS